MHAVLGKDGSKLMEMRRSLEFESIAQPSPNVDERIFILELCCPDCRSSSVGLY